jgi:hypothetical protein
MFSGKFQPPCNRGVTTNIHLYTFGALQTNSHYKNMLQTLQLMKSLCNQIWRESRNRYTTAVIGLGSGTSWVKWMPKDIMTTTTVLTQRPVHTIQIFKTLHRILYIHIYEVSKQNMQLNDTFTETYNPIYDMILTKIPTKKERQQLPY